MITVVSRVGRLIEIRVRGQVDAAAFTQFRDEFVCCFERQQGKRVVVAADMRNCSVKPDVFEPYLRMLKNLNPLVERTSLLLDRDGVLFMAVGQISDAANNPARKTALKESEMREWLEPCLSEPEKVRLAAFLDEAAVAS